MASSEPPAKGGRIPEELQREAKMRDSPVVGEILVAARKGFTDEVLRLLQQRGQSSVTDKHGRNCLQLACLNGRFATVMSILQTGLMDVNAANKRGLTALHDVCSEGHSQIALLLLAVGGYVQARTKDGWTSLMCACSNGHLQLAQIIIAAGGEVNAATRLGLTALHVAAWKGHAAIVEMLIRAGANTLAQATNGKTALQLAQEEEQHECITLLQGATSKLSEDSCLRISALEGQVRLCEDKLAQTQKKFADMLKDERAQHKSNMENLEKEFAKKLEESSKKLKEKEETIVELEKCLGTVLQIKPPDVKVDSPKGSPARKRKYKPKSTRKSSDTSTLTNNTSECRDIFSPSPSLSLELRLKSASFSDLSTASDEKTIHSEKKSETQTSPNQASSRVGSERTTITAMVADSINNPDSIAAIRKQLKSDSLTPRIQRKFHLTAARNSTPKSLPAMNTSSSSTETSPLVTHRQGNGGLAKVSPPTPRSTGPGRGGKETAEEEK